MATYVKIAGTQYPAEIFGRIKDPAWNDRASKTITLTMGHTQALGLFVDGLAWSIVMDITDESGTVTQEEYDNSAYSVAGDITDHRDGTVSVKMGKPTAGEELTETQAALEILGYTGVKK